MKANKLLISCCYGDRGYHKRDTEEVEAETEEIERETRISECVYYIQYSGGSHCNQYYKYVHAAIAHAHHYNDCSDYYNF